MSDVYTINEVLRHLNAEVVFENNQVTIDASKELNIEAPFEYVRKMRASVQVMGPLLARNGRAVLHFLVDVQLVHVQLTNI